MSSSEKKHPKKDWTLKDEKSRKTNTKKRESKNKLRNSKLIFH